ncbi:MAG: hypothetical protein JWN08_191 [Frankiales bacterium]|nr:hypothetical protein [Frankiales bacterium]
MDVAVQAGTAVVRMASRLRGERAIHARGRALTGRLTVTGGAATGAPLLDEPASYDVVVRLSRSLGLPPRLPDVLGLAVRVLDAHGPGAHQDLLLDSTRAEPVLRRLPLPAHDHLRATHGSLVPYDVGGRRLLIGARGLAGSATRLPDVTVASFGLLVATAHGPWQQVGTVRTTAELPAPQGRALRFNPAVTGGGLRLAGPFHGWRQRAYPVSQDVG